jgi:hypothetical protein
MFQAVALLEFLHPPELFPRPEPPRLSAGSVPSCRSPSPRSRRRSEDLVGGVVAAAPPHCTRGFRDPTRAAAGLPVAICDAGSASGPCSPGRVRCTPTGGEACRRPDALLGFRSPPGFSPSPPRPVLPPAILPRASGGPSPAAPARARPLPYRPAPRSLHGDEAGRAASARRTLLGFFHLVSHLVGSGAAPPWLWVHLGSARRVAAAA